MHCGQSSSLTARSARKASQGPSEGNLEQDPDAVEGGWGNDGHEQRASQGTGTSPYRALHWGGGHPEHEAGALLGQAEVALAAV